MTLEELKARVREYHGDVADEIPLNVYCMFLMLLNDPHPEGGNMQKEYEQGVIDSLLNLAGMVSDGDLGLRGDNE